MKKGKMKKNIVYLFLNEAFYVLGVAYLTFVLLEIFFPGMILAYIDINFILIFWLIIGIFIVVNNKKR